MKVEIEVFTEEKMGCTVYFLLVSTPAPLAIRIEQYEYAALLAQGVSIIK